jgi:hypothetical protein
MVHSNEIDLDYEMGCRSWESLYVLLGIFELARLHVDAEKVAAEVPDSCGGLHRFTNARRSPGG